MLHGKGRNNIAYMFFDSYEYTNAPGGICNGITGGYEDPKAEGIDFGLRYAQTGKDDDWRWAEQWLPHAAWYLVGDFSIRRGLMGSDLSIQNDIR